MTAQSRRVGLVVPSSWWTVPLADEEARRRSISMLVDRQVGRDDRKAGLRRELRTELAGAAETAATAGGILMAVSTMTVDGLPVPATMTVYPAPGQMDTATADALVAMLTQDAPELPGQALSAPEPEGDAQAWSPGEEWARSAVEVIELDHGPAVRRVAYRRGPRGLDAQEQPVLLVEYWLDPGDGSVVNVTFSSPLVQLGAALVELFDLVVDTIDVEDTEEPGTAGSEECS
ncbi:hypothetical protein [Cellulomonas sp.]|uniref:hypothetical protein n=1 Tax=Cellulomonas sp. TaxID=40001 RepID=UPI001B021D1B|nr:hypothetical protein [Cellulomonas sp.]MBO9554708.1 hypothetical protein [Cellulomonas sp.]